MDSKWKSRLLPAALMVAAAIVFCAGITWGLPSRAVDRYLFGDRPVWSGEKIQQLAGQREYDPTRGADVDIDPLAKDDRVIWLNETDQQRAEIIRRYRLYTHQPDEMITMMALASMRPGQGDLDPKLYQYGGLWIYPVGALLKIASVCRAVNLKSDLTYYLDYPEEFGRFYVVARLYVVAWALIGVWSVYWITRRFTNGSLWPAAFAALCYIAMPVVINMAHEAKPHLPGAVLMLLAVMAAIRYVETGKRRWWIMTGLLCGAAFGMVLSAMPVFIILPVMVLLRGQSWRHRTTIAVISGVIGCMTYFITNPYVAINFFTNREVLQSNLSNSIAMYEITRLGEGLCNAAWLVAEGTSTIIAVVGLLGAAGLLIQYPFNKEKADKKPISKSGWLLLVPTVVILMQFVALAAGKPGEYGRFAIFPDIALCIAAIISIHLFLKKTSRQISAMSIVLAITALYGGLYLSAFIRDTSSNNWRMRVAEHLDSFKSSGGKSLGILSEPAPYVLPPVDIFSWKLFLFPEEYVITDDPSLPDVLIHPWGTSEFKLDPDSSSYAGPIKYKIIYNPIISWANKPFIVRFKGQAIRSPSTQGSSNHAN